MLSTLEQIEREYRKKIQEVFEQSGLLTAGTMVELAIELFHEFKVFGISDDRYSYSDMLLFQYGVYNWGDEFGKHFELDITRQFTAPAVDEPYQLSFKLIYEPEPFKWLLPHTCWSSKFADVDGLAAHIKTKRGFKLAEKQIAKAYALDFGKC